MHSLRALSPAGFLALALLEACLSTGTASAQDSKRQLSSWDNLESLTKGQRIGVVMKDFKFYEGEFESLSDGGITLRQAAGEQTLARNDTRSVSIRKGQDHRVRNLLTGLVVGAGAGLATGLVANHVIWSHVNCDEGPAFGCGYPPNPHWGIILTSVGGLGGAIVGGLIPTGGWHDIYRAH